MGVAPVAADDPVAHLLRRITFVARSDDVAAARTLGAQAVIDAALAGRPYPGSDQGVPAGIVDPSGRPFFVSRSNSGLPAHGVISADEAEAVAQSQAEARDAAAATTKVAQQQAMRRRLDDAALAQALAGGVSAAVSGAPTAQQLVSGGAQVYDPAADLTAAQMWWTDRMVRTAWPLQELMVLFWHNHFATADYKVNSPALMIRQNQLFRAHALGNFRDLMRAVAIDPAMLLWLDGNTSHKRAPNENFGREFMELFTLGLGYTQDDVDAAARAFTGWHYNAATDQVVFNPKDHDDGQKTFFGRTGPWTGDDVIGIALQQPAHGPFLMTKLWNAFVGTPPSAAQLGPVVDAYLQHGYEIQPALRAILSSPAFSSPEAMWSMYRGPARFVVAAMRALGRPVVDATPPATMRALGQDLFNPPNVGGWPGGATWINAGTLLGRFNFGERLAGSEPRQALVPLAQGLQKGDSAGVVDALVARAGLHGVSDQSRQALIAYAQAAPWTVRTVEEKLGGLIHLVLSAPEFQLV